MGCGQSRMGMVYPRKWKTRSEKRKGVANPWVAPFSSDAAQRRSHYLCSSWRKASAFLTLGSRSDRLGAEDNEYDDDGTTDTNADSCNSSNSTNSSKWDNPAGRRRYSAPLSNRSPRPHTIPGPILAQSELSSSQLEFFRMLDEKIESGKDYESEDEHQKTITSLEKSKFSLLNPILQYHDPYLQQHQHAPRCSNQVDRIHARERYDPRQGISSNVPQSSAPETEFSPQSPLSSWPNGSLTNYMGESLVSRGLRSPMNAGRDAADSCEDAAKESRATKSESRSKSWFSDPYSGWSLRKLGDVLRDDKDKSNNAKKRGANSKDPSKRKSIA